MATITKKELVERIANKHQIKRTIVQNVVKNFLNEIVTELADGNRFEFRDFGVFETKTRAARVGRNPRTLESVQIPAKRAVKFKAGRLMKQKLNGAKCSDETKND